MLPFERAGLCSTFSEKRLAKFSTSGSINVQPISGLFSGCQLKVSRIFMKFWQFQMVWTPDDGATFFHFDKHSVCSAHIGSCLMLAVWIAFLLPVLLMIQIHPNPTLYTDLCSWVGPVRTMNVSIFTPAGCWDLSMGQKLGFLMDVHPRKKML